MSQYIFFYARKNDVFVPLSEFSGSSICFSAIRDFITSYEKLCTLSDENIAEIKESIKSEISTVKEEMKGIKRRIKKINEIPVLSIETAETIDREIQDLEDMLKLNRETKASLVFVLNFFTFLEIIKENKEVEIYWGVDCVDPTAEDIEER